MCNPPKDENFDVINFTGNKKKAEVKITNKKNKAPTKPLVEKSAKTTKLEEDFFDENGLLKEDEFENPIEILTENLSYILEMLNNICISIWDKFKNSIVFTIIERIGFMFISIMNKILGILTKIANLMRLNVKTVNKTSEEEKEEEEVEEELYIGTFDSLFELNITLTDNYDKLLIKKNLNSNFALTDMEEDIAMSRALDSIKECSSLAKNFSDPEEGMFVGRTISNILENVNSEEVGLFLGYIEKRPKKYSGKTWKISEIFATWAINGSPIITI